MTSDMPRPDIECSIWIARPPREIWKYVTDWSHETQWRNGVTDARWVSDPPHGVGSTGLHIVEGIGDWPWKLTEWEEPHNVSWDVTGGPMKGGHAGYRFAPEGTGSRVTLHARVKRPSLMGIIIPFMKRSMTRQMVADLEKLKAIMEA
jgi:uncharacterized protein YndB with AHSA1/START domain